MSSINVQKSSQQTKIYDKYYNVEFVISTQEYDIVYAYFKKVMNEDEEVAKNFTASIFKLSKDTGVSALTYLENLKGQDAVQLSLTMTYYLNQVRSNSTLLGVGQIITPNFYAARNVVS